MGWLSSRRLRSTAHSRDMPWLEICLTLCALAAQPAFAANPSVGARAGPVSQITTAELNTALADQVFGNLTPVERMVAAPGARGANTCDEARFAAQAVQAAEEIAKRGGDRSDRDAAGCGLQSCGAS